MCYWFIVVFLLRFWMVDCYPSILSILCLEAIIHGRVFHQRRVHIKVCPRQIHRLIRYRPVFRIIMGPCRWGCRWTAWVHCWDCSVWYVCVLYVWPVQNRIIWQYSSYQSACYVIWYLYARCHVDAGSLWLISSAMLFFCAMISWSWSSCDGWDRTVYPIWLVTWRGRVGVVWILRPA